MFTILNNFLTTEAYDSAQCKSNIRNYDYVTEETELEPTLWGAVPPASVIALQEL